VKREWTHVPDINAAKAQYAGAIADLCDLSRCSLGLFHAATNNAGIRAEMYERPRLGAADAAGTAGNEEHAAGYEAVDGVSEIGPQGGRCASGSG
jgi:hypothetical protein